ncbi:(2Fe-2S)-binding protein [Nocardioides terrisoli]|uniref:(2Fe-2S)-binding protein n=1 Tax=Nocardioides terrisoli TaxID=3388267 RepID=UPI00287B9FF5|nr:2Fe-2S iron-sulfur cluster-binding protein [Nocardioides marmorisolisilvae]
MTFELKVNGRVHVVSSSPFSTLAEVLREDCGLTGTKIGCGVGYCGACTVLLDGEPVHACCMIAGDCVDAVITTIEGAREEPEGAEVISACARLGAVQCGFCTAGFVMSAVGMPDAACRSRASVRDYLVGNICRCTGYAKLIDAVYEAKQVAP